MEVTGGRVAIVMGSQSDWPTMKAAAEVLEEFILDGDVCFHLDDEE
jgi:phosphoribosylcarboxyaminoimidazole (NCAIR) mutase